MAGRVGGAADNSLETSDLDAMGNRRKDNGDST